MQETNVRKIHNHTLNLAEDGLTHVKLLSATDGGDSTMEDAIGMATQSPERVAEAIVDAWDSLQQVPSYIECRLALHRGLLESIATQR